METTEKARGLLLKHLYIHGGDDLGISDGNVYMACLDAISEALNMADVVESLPTDEEIEQEAELRYPVKRHVNPNDSPYVGSKKTFIHGCRYMIISAKQ